MKDKKHQKKLQKIVDDCNQLARKLLAMQNFEVCEGFEFYNSISPRGIGAWAMAMAAYDHIAGTEVDQVLEELKDILKG